MGCLAYAHNIDHKGDKFTSWSHQCVFLGYPYGKKGWRLFDLEREIVFTSRDVVFQETVFPFAVSISPYIQQKDVTSEVSTGHPTMGEFDSDSDAEPSLPVARESSSSGVERQESFAAPSVSQSVSPETIEAEPVTELLGRGHRTKKTNVKLRDYVVDAISAPSSSLSLVS